MKRLSWLLCAWLISTPALGQVANKDTTWPTPGNNVAQGGVQMCINPSGQAVPCTSPTGQTQVTGAFSGADTTTQAATLAGTAGKTTFICGFSVSGLGSTAGGQVSVTVATLTGPTTLTYSYVFAAGAAVANTPIQFTYNPCLPASAVNTAITVTVPGQAGNTATQINTWGYQQ
jgi:hypothetical protein